jgi:hypothetical protein
MLKKEDIDDALIAHSQWKKRFQDAISHQPSDFNPEAVKKDDICQFGKWLHGLSAEDTQNEDYKTVKTLHADFHKTAGEILELVLSGEKDEAMKKIESGGQYSNMTGRLVLALRAWRLKV